ncbi:MAG: SurA N-terminal domain-containing protein [Tannerella sp.]|jgi:peptidyl-prolyl cis-trans isomerase D|nr:SurA N-terminal domain-containing protein [Tannerella sp.]
MATLEKIRNHAGLLVIAVGLALFAFIINDALNSSSTYLMQSRDDVATVNGSSIKQQDYSFRIEEMTEVYKIQSQKNSVDEYKDQISQNVYDMMVREVIINDEFGDLGIYVTPEELFDMIGGENVSPMVQQFPLFMDPSTGVYNKAYALDILKSFDNLDNFAPAQRVEVEKLRNFWLFWERNMKTQRLQEKYTNLLSKALVVNPLEAKDAYESSRESSDIVFAMQAYSTIPDSLINVDNSEIKKLYSDRKEQYKQKEGRIIDYIAVEVRPSEADYENARKEIEDIKNEFVSAEDMETFAGTTSNVSYMDAFISAGTLDAEMRAFAETAQIGDIDGPVFTNDSYNLMKFIDKTVAPDSVKVSHIYLVSLTSPTGTDSTVTARADSLVDVLKNGGDFAELAAQYSFDDQTKTNGGEIGWLTEATILQGGGGKELKDGVFSAPLNQPTILKTNRGIHILRITEKTADVPKYKIARAHLEVTPSNKTYNDIYNQLSQFVAINNTSEKISASAAEAGYNLISGIRITASDRVLGAVPDSRVIIRWAFESTRKNEVSNIIDCNNQFVIAVRREVLPEGYQSINAVAPILRSEIAARKKGELIAKSLKEKNLQSLQAYADVMNSPIDTVRYITMETSRITKIGLEPALNAEITYSQPNRICGPVIGNNGVYVFTVINRTTEGGTYDEKEQIASMEMSNSYKSYQAFQQLVNQAKIVDNRIRFD